MDLSVTGWNTEAEYQKARMEMGRPEMRVADILHAHRSCNVAEWKDHAMQ